MLALKTEIFQGMFYTIINFTSSKFDVKFCLISFKITETALNSLLIERRIFVFGNVDKTA